MAPIGKRIALVLVILAVSSICLAGCATIPIPSSVPLPSEIPILNWFFV